MNSSSEPVTNMIYERMEYSESGEYTTNARAAETADPQPAVENQEPPQPDPAMIFATRLEEETRAVAAQSRAELEREVQRARAAIGEAVSLFSEQRDAYFRQVEGEVVQLALGIARRIVHRESQVDPRMVAALVHFELDQLDIATSVRLVVAPDALNYWNDAASSMPRTVEVVVDRSITPGTLRMETALGSTAINFEGELKEIERGFFDLLAHRPAAEEARTARVQ